MSPSPPQLRVALLQTCPRLLDPERNFATAAEHIRDAASQGASLAVLPEYHLTGWVPEDERFRTFATQAHSFLLRYQRLAKEYRIHIVPGTIVMQDCDTGNNRTDALLNKSYFITNQGELLGEYAKVNLWHPERDHLTPGVDLARASMKQHTSRPNHHSVIETPIGPVGLLICYDLAFPEAFRALVRAGARIIIIPTFTKSDDMSEKARSYNQSGEELFVRSALISRAFENTCCIIFCNVGGPKGDNFMGLSQVVLPIVGTVTGSFDDSTEGMRVVDVDLNVLDVAEDNYKVREDLGRDNFHYK